MSSGLATLQLSAGRYLPRGGGGGGGRDGGGATPLGAGRHLITFADHFRRHHAFLCVMRVPPAGGSSATSRLLVVAGSLALAYYSLASLIGASVVPPGSVPCKLPAAAAASLTQPRRQPTTAACPSRRDVQASAWAESCTLLHRVCVDQGAKQQLQRVQGPAPARHGPPRHRRIALPHTVPPPPLSPHWPQAPSCCMRSSTSPTTTTARQTSLPRSFPRRAATPKQCLSTGVAGGTPSSRCRPSPAARPAAGSRRRTCRTRNSPPALCPLFFTHSG